MRDDLVFLASAEWDEFVQRTIANDYTGGMDARVAAQALQHSGIVPELTDGSLILDGGSQFGVLFFGTLQVNIQLIGDHFSDPVAVTITPAQHAADIANYAFCSERTEGDNL